MADGETRPDSHLRTEINPHLVRLALYYDEAWRLPFTKYRVGLDAIVGLVPGLGDVATAALGVWMLKEAKRLGVPRHKRAVIVGYYLIDLLGGLVPVVGDAFDVAYKANKKSLVLLQDHVDDKVGTPA